MVRSKPPSPPAGLAPHDHAVCISAALSSAEALCAERGVQLTALRRRVLELVWASHTPIGAYELLAKLAEETGRVQPPTVYRALDFLKTQGLIHRIESRNAFIGCAHPEARHNGQFLLCRACGQTAELADDAVLSALQREAEALGYTVERQTIELEGLCPRCRQEEAGTSLSGASA